MEAYHTSRVCQAVFLLLSACVSRPALANGATPAGTQADFSRQVSTLVTAYCPCAKCCGKYADGKTATGTDAYTRGAAVAPKLISYGSVLDIPDYGRCVADDTGGAMRNAAKRGEYHIDVRFPTHKEALAWGRKRLTVTIWSSPP